MIKMSGRINFRLNEKKLLILIVEKYKNVIESKENNSEALAQKGVAWDAVMREYNSKTDIPRSKKQLKNLYFNLKRKVVRKDVNQYLEAMTIAEEDKESIKEICRGSYLSNQGDTGAPMLVIMPEQIKQEVEPLQEDYNTVTSYFNDNCQNIGVVGASPRTLASPTIKTSSPNSPEICTSPISFMSESSVPSSAATQKSSKFHNKKNINYKQLYYKKRYQTACREYKTAYLGYKSKLALHRMELKIKKVQLALAQKQL